VAGAVYVRVVPLLRLIFHVRRVNRDSARFLFRRFVDFVIAHRRRVAVFRQHHRDRRRQRGLSMVYVADRSHVYVRLIALKFCLRHLFVSSLIVVD